MRFFYLTVAVFAFLALNVRASPVDDDQMYKTMLSEIVQNMLDFNFEISTSSEVTGHKMNYTLLTLVWKRDDEYSFELYHSFYYIRVLIKGIIAVYEEFVRDMFWCSKHSFQPLDQEIVNTIKPHIQNGRIINLEQSGQDVVNGTFVNQQGNIKLDFQVKNNNELILLKATAENFFVPKIIVTITKLAFPLEIRNEKFQIDQECKGIEEPASDRPFYYSFLHVL